MNTTEWFKWNDHPVRPGVYQRNFGFRVSESPVFAYWDGAIWYWWGDTATDADDNFHMGRKSNCQMGFDWRGLTERNNGQE